MTTTSDPRPTIHHRAEDGTWSAWDTGFDFTADDLATTETLTDWVRDYLRDQPGEWYATAGDIIESDVVTIAAPDAEKVWAEVGEWTRGERALVIMTGDVEDGVVLLHDVALPMDDVRPSAMDAEVELKALGYRKVPGAREDATPYGVAFDIEKW